MKLLLFALLVISTAFTSSPPPQPYKIIIPRNTAGKIEFNFGGGSAPNRGLDIVTEGGNIIATKTPGATSTFNIGVNTAGKDLVLYLKGYITFFGQKLPIPYYPVGKYPSYQLNYEDAGDGDYNDIIVSITIQP